MCQYSLSNKNYINEVKLLKSNETEKIYSVNSTLNLGDLEETLMMILMNNGVDIDNVHFKTFGSEIVAENF